MCFTFRHIKIFRKSIDGTLNFMEMKEQWPDIADKLHDKGIIIGSKANASLTLFGKILFDRCDRNKKLIEILNE